MASKKRKTVISGPVVNLLLAFTMLAVLFLAVELLVRVCLFHDVCDIPGFNDPVYFTRYLNEDYFLLQHSISREFSLKPNESNWDVHPLLGWDYQKNRDTGWCKTDGFGAQVADTIYDNTTTKVLFYGDSFTETIAPSNETLPAKLEREVGLDTLNLGVGGYGFDQTYLKFESTHRAYNGSVILLGVLFDDLERSILKGVRTSQKPYFELSDNGSELVLKGVPVYSDPEEYFMRNKPKIKSYLLSRVYNSPIGSSLFRDFQVKEDELRNSEIKAINKKIVEEVRRTRDLENLTLYLVLFYAEPELKNDNWLHLFFRDLLNEQNITYLDTKEYLVNYSASNNISLSDFYNPQNTHLSELGQTVIAEGIARDIREHT